MWWLQLPHINSVEKRRTVSQLVGVTILSPSRWDGVTSGRADRSWHGLPQITGDFSMRGTRCRSAGHLWAGEGRRGRSGRGKGVAQEPVCGVLPEGHCLHRGVVPLHGHCISTSRGQWAQQQHPAERRQWVNDKEQKEMRVGTADWMWSFFSPSSAAEHQGDLGTLPPRRLRGLSLLAGLQRGSGLSPLLHLVLQQDGGEALRPLPSPGERAGDGEGVSAARRLLLLHGLVHGAGHQEVLQQHGGPADGQGWVSEGTWDFPTSAVLVVSFSFEYTMNSVGLFIRKGSKV